MTTDREPTEREHLEGLRREDKFPDEGCESCRFLREVEKILRKDVEYAIYERQHFEGEASRLARLNGLDKKRADRYSMALRAIANLLDTEDILMARGIAQSTLNNKKG